MHNQNVTWKKISDPSAYSNFWPLLLILCVFNGHDIKYGYVSLKFVRTQNIFLIILKSKILKQWIFFCLSKLLPLENLNIAKCSLSMMVNEITSTIK